MPPRKLTQPVTVQVPPVLSHLSHQQKQQNSAKIAPVSLQQRPSESILRINKPQDAPNPAPAPVPLRRAPAAPPRIPSPPRMPAVLDFDSIFGMHLAM